MSKKKKVAAGVVAGGLACVAFLAYMIVLSIQFDRNCKGYLKRAADANSVELGEKELAKALAYCKRAGLDTPEGRSRGMIDDHTSILYTTPDEQISFWHDNLTACHAELVEVIEAGDATPLEKSNVLMKLRETLLDGRTVTYPGGLAYFPHNLAIGLIGVLSILGLFVLAIAGFVFLGG